MSELDGLFNSSSHTSITNTILSEVDDAKVTVIADENR
ncbi:hypothetical protein BH09BAC3_BH09BAC3_08120 [soil metagenome]